MSDEAGSDTHPVVVRRPQIDIHRASSRLIQRGLTALETPRTIQLDVWELQACESSVFIFTLDWDPYWNDSLNKSESWKDQRRVAFFEFHRTGQFVQKLVLQLITLSDHGYSNVLKRTSGRVTIQPELIHFYEEFTTKQNSREVRVDYLFSFGTPSSSVV